MVLSTTILTSIAQILYKLGSKKLNYNIIGVLTNYPIIIGVLLYAIAGIIMILSLRGGEVSVLYPIIATSYIWVSILSIYFLGEKMNSFKWIGIIAIIFGIVSISCGDRRIK